MKTVQPILFFTKDAPPYPKNLTFYELFKRLREHWAGCQDWMQNKLGCTFAVSPLIITHGSHQQYEYNQHSVYQELHDGKVVNLDNRETAMYVHLWGPTPDMEGTGTYDGNAWGYPHKVGRCMDAPTTLTDICNPAYRDLFGRIKWAPIVAQGRDLHELGHAILQLPDYDDVTVSQIMWEWWDYPDCGFTASEKAKALESPWLWVK